MKKRYILFTFLCLFLLLGCSVSVINSKNNEGGAYITLKFPSKKGFKTQVIPERTKSYDINIISNKETLEIKVTKQDNNIVLTPSNDPRIKATIDNDVKIKIEKLPVGSVDIFVYALGNNDIKLAKGKHKVIIKGGEVERSTIILNEIKTINLNIKNIPERTANIEVSSEIKTYTFPVNTSVALNNELEIIKGTDILIYAKDNNNNKLAQAKIKFDTETTIPVELIPIPTPTPSPIPTTTPTFESKSELRVYVVGIPPKAQKVTMVVISEDNKKQFEETKSLEPILINIIIRFVQFSSNIPTGKKRIILTALGDSLNQSVVEYELEVLNKPLNIFILDFNKKTVRTKRA